MIDASDGRRPDGQPVRADGGEAPNLGEYVHEPAVDQTEADDPLSGAETASGAEGADSTAAADGATTERGGATSPTADGTAADGRAAGDAREDGRRERAARVTADDRAREHAAANRETAADRPDLPARVAASVADGTVRGTVGGVVGVYGLLGAGIALLAVLVGQFAPPVVETTWEPYPLVSTTALLTAVPAVSVALAVLVGVYAAVRLDRVDGAVAGGLGASLGAVLATWLTIGGVAVGAGGGTIRVDGVLVASVFLAVVGGGVAAGVALVAARLGVGAADAPDAPADPDATDGDDRAEGAAPQS